MALKQLDRCHRCISVKCNIQYHTLHNVRFLYRSTPSKLYAGLYMKILSFADSVCFCMNFFVYVVLCYGDGFFGMKLKNLNME